MKPILSATLVLVFATAHAENMDRYRGVNNSGYYAATGLLRSWPDGGPPLLWKATPGAGWANVAVVDGKVYFVGGKTATLFVHDLDGILLNKATAGSAIWKKWDGSRTTPMVHDGIAVVGMPNANYVGIDLQTMESKWQVNAWKEFGSGKGNMGWGWPESPMRHENKLIFNPCSRDEQTPGVAAVDLQTGKMVWGLPGRPAVTNATGKTDRYSATDVSGALFRHNGRDIVAYPTWVYLVGLDANTGQKLWEFKAEGSKNTTPIYADGRLLWSPPGHVQMLALNADGSAAHVLWTRAGAGGFSQGAMFGGRVYVVGDKNAVPVPGKTVTVDGPVSEDADPPPKPAVKGETALLCLDAATGKLIASLPSNANANIVAAEGMVYAADVAGKGLRVRLIRPTADGMEVAGELNVPGTGGEGGWHWAISPVVAEGRLFVRYGELFVYDLRVEKPATYPGGVVEGARPPLPFSRTMNLRWTADVAGNSVVMTRQHVVASGDGKVTGVDVATGKVLWSVPGKGGPVVREDAVFVTGQRLNLADGKPVWTAKVAGEPLLSENVVVTQGKDLVGTDAGTGKELWRRTGQSGRPTKLRVDGVGYIVTGEGTVVRANDGELVSQDSPVVAVKRLEAKVKATGAGVVADGKLFVPTARSLVALDIATGEQVGEFALPAPLTGPVTLANGNLYLPGATTLVMNTKLEKQWEFTGKDVALAFNEDRVAVLAGGKLFCFAGPTPGAPKPLGGVEVTARTELPAGLPVTAFASDQFIESWLWAAPIPGFDLKTDFVGGREKFVPGLGTKFTVGEKEYTFQLLATNHYWGDARFSGGKKTVAFTSVHERKYNTTGYYATAIENDRDRWVRFATLFAGGSHWRARFDYRAWLDGQPLDEVTVYRLPKGKHVILMQAGMGECESWGQIYMHPRFLDVTEETEKQLAKQRATQEAWQRYQTEEAGKPLALP
jgi:outer membrane protein assembly factor BamB